MSEPADSISVGLGEIKISRSPEQVLVAFGLGSCVGVGMYDPVAHVGGMLHAVLPERTNGDNADKYVNTGIANLLDRMIDAGADRKRLIIKMAGGANILNVSGFKALNIGERNVASANATFSALNLKLKATDTGGTLGRTVRMYIADGHMTIRAIGNPEKAF